jgi:hypothetical protein
MKESWTFRAFLFLMSGVLAFGCNRGGTDSSSEKADSPASTTQTALTIQPSDAPAGVDSREPELTSTADGRIILSWV